VRFVPSLAGPDSIWNQQIQVVFRLPSGHLMGVPEPLPIVIWKSSDSRWRHRYRRSAVSVEEPNYLRAWEKMTPSNSWLDLQQDVRWEKIKPMEWEILYDYDSNDILRFVQNLLKGQLMAYASSLDPQYWSRGERRSVRGLTKYGHTGRDPDHAKEEQFHRHLRATLKQNQLPSLVRIEYGGQRPSRYFLSPVELKAWNGQNSIMTPRILKELYPNILFMEDRNGRRRIADQANIPEGAGIESARAILDPFYYTFAHLYGAQVMDAAFQDENQ
jgi:hypothetical protein